MTVYFLQVDTFRGIAIGASHYYGAIYNYNEYEKIEDLYYILEQEHVDAFKKTDRDFDFEVGEESFRFWSERDVDKAAIAWYESNCDPEVDILVRWNPVHHFEKGEHSILRAPNLKELRRMSAEETDEYLRKARKK